MTMELREEVARVSFKFWMDNAVRKGRRPNAAGGQFEDMSTEEQEFALALADINISVIQSRAKGQPGVDGLADVVGFARWVIDSGPFAGCDLEGGEIQDAAVEHGVLVETTYNPDIHGDNADANPGDRWFVFAPSLEPRSTPSNPGGWRTDMENAPRDGKTPIDIIMRTWFWNADGEKQIGIVQRLPDCIWFDGQWTNEDGSPHSYLEGFTNIEFVAWMPTPKIPDDVFIPPIPVTEGEGS